MTSRWESRAACKHVPLKKRNEIFFPATPGNPNLSYPLARKYCGPCPVQKECLDSAIKEENRYPFGFRGNKTAAERYKLFYEYKAKGLASTRNQDRNPLYYVIRKIKLERKKKANGSNQGS